MDVLAFKIYGKFWHFRKFYTTTSPLSFSIPPFTVIRWAIAGILWKEKDSYNEEFSKIKLWVKLNFNASNKKMFWLNLTNTKDNWHIQVKQETLLNPCYTIYVWSKNFREYEKLKVFLEKWEFVYTPYLGIAQFIANITYLWEEKNIEKLNLENVEIDSIVPIEKLNNWENLIIQENQFIEFEKIPYSMDNERNMKKLQEFAFDIAWWKLKLKKFDGYDFKWEKIYLV